MTLLTRYRESTSGGVVGEVPNSGIVQLGEVLLKDVRGVNLSPDDLRLLVLTCDVGAQNRGELRLDA